MLIDYCIVLLCKPNNFSAVPIDSTHVSYAKHYQFFVLVNMYLYKYREDAWRWRKHDASLHCDQCYITIINGKLLKTYCIICNTGTFCPIWNLGQICNRTMVWVVCDAAYQPDCCSFERKPTTKEAQLSSDSINQRWHMRLVINCIYWCFPCLESHLLNVCGWRLTLELIIL